MNNNNNMQALIVALHIGMYRPRKLDKKISREVAAQHATDERAGDYMKNLFPSWRDGSVTVHTYPELVAVNSSLNKHYVWHASETLVWDGDGRRILPYISADEHKVRTDSMIAALPALLDSLEYGFQAAMVRAEARLNGMFRESDYPRSGSEIRDKFYLTCEYEPIPQFVSGMPSGIESMINSQIETRVKAGVESITNDAWQRLFKCVQNFHARMVNPTAKYHESLVGNMRDVCEVLTRLNVANDAELETMRAAVENNLAKWDIQTLKDSEIARADAAKTAEILLSGIKGKRSIVRVQDAT